MPIVYADDTAHCVDACSVDEALDLLEWLHSQPRAKLDLKSCTHLHTAILQLILVARPQIIAEPADLFLTRCLGELARAHPPPRRPSGAGPRGEDA